MPLAAGTWQGVWQAFRARGPPRWAALRRSGAPSIPCLRRPHLCCPGTVLAWPGIARGAAQRSTPAAPGDGGGTAEACGSCVVRCADEAATGHLAEAFARELRPGDAYLLHGHVGAGKSSFARAFIRAAEDDPELPVTSPTFLLLSCYDEIEGQPPIYHMDLYRVSGPSDLGRMDIPTCLASGVCLIEWPERLGAEMTPASRVDVHVRAIRGTGRRDREGSGQGMYEDDMVREFRFVPHGAAWRERVASVLRLLQGCEGVQVQVQEAPQGGT